MNNREMFKTSPEYRAKVIRELEKSGAISKLPSKEFGMLVYSDSVPSILKV